MNIDIILKNNKYKELLNNDIEKNKNICLISQEIINDSINLIKLPCGHTFDYKNLFNEIKNQKYYFYKVDSENMKSDTIKCPYCRKVFNNLLPFHEIDNICRIRNINSPNSKIMPLYKCQWKFKSGKNKDKLCNCSANFYKNGYYCEKHHKLMIKKDNNSNENRCCAILKSGSRKGMQCDCIIKDKNFKYCKKHLPKEIIDLT
tara:strand:- start:444 stop:1052 length:609 start_codon:yes stop_codon:yes gene_type:complete